MNEVSNISESVEEDYIRLPKKIDLSKQERKILDFYVKESVDMFRYTIYLQGVDIGFEKLYDLERKGYINAENRIQKGFSLKSDILPGESNKNLELAKIINDSTSKNPKNPHAVSNLMDADELEEIVDRHNFGFKLEPSQRGRSKIIKQHWDLTNEMFDYSLEFREWIDTINSGWQNLNKHFWKYELYKAQAYHWLYETPIAFNPLASRDEQIDMIKLERSRMLQNSLYATCKELKLKDDHDDRGYLDFNAWEAQAVVMYLFDCKLSLIIGKLRQIGFTSTIGGAAIIRTMLTPSYYTKLVAQKGDKSKEIFEHKVKFAISNFSNHIRPAVMSDNKSIIEFARKTSKGVKEGVQSIFHVDNPYEDVVNAGTPSLVLLDEAGLMDVIGGIVAEGRPTMFRVNPMTNKMELVRQLLIWGTGGNFKDGGSGFKEELNASFEAWADKDYRHGIIPLFINAFAKPGMNIEFYNAEKDLAYRKRKRPGKEDPKVIFHYTYPITKDDMFLSSAKTIIPISEINGHIARCTKKSKKLQQGYFEPIYDKSSKAGEFSDVPYKIIGAKFKTINDDDIDNESPLSCVKILHHPEEGWGDRYYKGTDPIMSESGTSKFSSAIWDEKDKTVSALLNFRISDYRWCYLQSLLMNIYYSKGNTKVRELLEINIGTSYYDYCKDKGFDKIFIRSTMLPDYLSVSGGANIGISKKGHNASHILRELEELIHVFSNNINIDDFWIQLKTYVKKESSSVTTLNGKYVPQNKNIDNDDALDSITYARLASKLYKNRTPYEIKSKENSNSYKMRYVYDANGNLTLQKVKVKQRIYAG